MESDEPLFLFPSFESFCPIPPKSGCGGGGRAGIGFLAWLLGSWEGTAGRSRGGCRGRLAVLPFDLFSLSSGTTMLLSLLTDRRRQISGLTGEVWNPEAGLASVLCGVCCCVCVSFGGNGGVSGSLSESFVLLVPLDRDRENTGDSASEETEETLGIDGVFVYSLGAAPPTGRRGIAITDVDVLLVGKGGDSLGIGGSVYRNDIGVEGSI